MDNLPTTAEPLLSDDIWKKFELDFPELFDETVEVKPFDCPLPSFNPDGGCVISKHDCMWAGHCASKEHPVDDLRLHPCLPTIVPVPLRPPPKPEPVKQQSLLKPAVRAAAATQGALQTPPMSDDEEARSGPTKVLQLLHQAILECDLAEESDLDDDSGLKEYFGEGEDVEVKVVDEDDTSNITMSKYAAESDHSYHKDRNASMRMAEMGLDTPSDSEEEIDVVSVGEKLLPSSSQILPTYPSTRDCQQIQRRMATAMNKSKPSNGIRTILPVRKLSSPERSGNATKRRLTDNHRGVKRSRQYRAAAADRGSPYKKTAAYRHSSDSDPEPSEKRSLHNNMERQRRIDLRNAFEELRLLVPQVKKKERAAKVVILREAAVYCNYMTGLSQDYTSQLDQLKRHQENLRAMVSRLRRSLAAKR